MLARAVTDLRLEALPDLESLGQEWDALALSSRNLFATREWVTAWWRHFGGGRPLRAWACRDGAGRLVGILPLYVARGRPVRILRFLGHGPGDQLGPICGADDRPAVADALRRAVAETDGWDLFLAERLPVDESWPELVGGVAVRHASSPVLGIDGRSWDDYLAAQTSHFRAQVRRLERKLLRERDLRYRLADDPERLDADLDLLFSLHDARWGSEGSGAFSGPRAAFHREFARTALERGWLRLWFAELDGRPVAAWHCMRYARREWCYQTGRDPAEESSRVGFVLLSHSIRSAFEDGLDEFRFLLGPEGYKARFADGDPGVDTRAHGRGPAGRGALAAMRGVLRLPPKARKRLGLARLAG